LRTRAACFLGVLCVSTVNCFALDREAFTFTNYHLNVRIDPEQQRLGVRGKIVLRNDSQSPQKNLSLQISSTLHWSSIQFEDKPVEYSSQIYTSDIDHTGALTEAIVTLQKPLSPKQTIELEIGYEGVIPQDTTRLIRIGVPADVAKHSDWDQISPSFTGVRGLGYVAWYPIATDAASLSEGNSVLEAVGRWKQRESQAEMMKIEFFHSDSSGSRPILFCDGRGSVVGFEQVGRMYSVQTECWFDSLATAVPLFLIGNFEALDKPAVNISFLPGHKSGAENYALAVEETSPFVSKWFGDHKEKPFKAEVIELPDPDAAPFESGDMLLMPLTVKDSTLLLSAIQQLTHVSFPSPRTWIYDGLARYAQLSFLQERGGRQAVLDYLQSHRESLLASEKQTAAQDGNRPPEYSLINASDEFLVQVKAMNLWWMLRDMVGETALNAALHNYNAADDKDTYYMQKLIEAQAHRDLEWFFDDWVYRDRGLPDFRIVSVYPRQLLSGGYMVTVTVENLGEAAAEVPVTLHMGTGEASGRLMVPGKSKASVRIPATAMPQDVTVNDGSVPESDVSNNVYRLESAPNEK
jgi:hypothetical protein